MYFDALAMACVADELRRTILGGRVQKALLPDELSIALEIYAQHERHNLLVSAHTELGRVSLSSEKPRRGVEKETGLLLLLRKYVRGAVVSAVEQPPFERILHLQFDHPELGSSELIVEVMGRHSNIILVGAGQVILDAVKRVGAQLNPKRPIVPGQPYAAPPTQARLLPSELTEYRLQQILTGAEADAQVWQLLVGGLRGVSPLLAREIAYRALGEPRALARHVQQLSPLLDALHTILMPLADGRWQPTLVMEEGRPAAYAPYPVTHQDQLAPVPSMSQAIETYVGAVLSGDPYAAAKRSARAAIAAARTRLQRRREALELPLQRAQQAEQWRQYGEWILAYTYAIVPGQTELAASTGDGDTLIIPLDPDRSPTENAQVYFARYRKARRAAEGGPARLAEVDLGLRDLEQLETDLDLASSRPEIEEVHTTLVEAGYVRAKARRVMQARRSRPLTLTSPDGLAIMVGRNSRQNDDLTFHWAKGDDWWFHARGVPGAHVVVRSDDKDLPPATLRQAAELAAYFSRLRSETSVVVDYTRRRHVRRIPGAAPGLVTYSQEESIRAAPRGPDTRCERSMKGT